MAIRKSVVHQTAAFQASSTPTWIDPMLATLSKHLPLTGEWLFEQKFDGFRALAFRTPKDIRLLSRNGLNLGRKFPEIVEALASQPSRNFIADGEIVARSGSGSSFAKLQQRLKPIDRRGAAPSGIKLAYWLFDLLYIEGVDLRPLPVLERKRILKEAFAFNTVIRFTTHRRGDPKHQSVDACKRGWEGVIAKKIDAPYLSGRSHAWLKIKCGRRQEFVIGGYTDPQGSRWGFGALLLGYYDRGRLKYAGKVGTGFGLSFLRDFSSQLMAQKRFKTAFDPHPALPNRAVHWVKPMWVAEVGFCEWTTDGQLRHPAFLGLRPDKTAAEVVRE